MKSRLPIWIVCLLLSLAGCLVAPPPSSGPSAAGPLPLETSINSVGMAFRKLPAGGYLMGAAHFQIEAEPDEFPQHFVTISRPTWIGVYEVTQAQYAAVTGEQPSWFCAQGDGAAVVAGIDTRQFPVEMVSWYEATRFCEQLSALPAEQAAGRRYRLPTEAEWEYACRAGRGEPFPSGLEPSSFAANSFRDLTRPQPVGSYDANGFGLFDMQGNVLEWCQDWHDPVYYQYSPPVDPLGPPAPVADTRVLRGGGWAFPAAAASFRDAIAPNLRGGAHGLRVVMEVSR